MSAGNKHAAEGVSGAPPAKRPELTLMRVAGPRVVLQPCKQAIRLLHVITEPWTSCARVFVLPKCSCCLLTCLGLAAYGTCGQDEMSLHCLVTAAAFCQLPAAAAFHAGLTHLRVTPPAGNGQLWSWQGRTVEYNQGRRLEGPAVRQEK